MGLLSWFSGSGSGSGSKPETTKANSSTAPAGETDANSETEVRRPDPPVDPTPLTVLEFGTGVKETLTGVCPISREIEPCVWKVEPIQPKPDSGSEDAPKIRILF